MNLKEDVMKKSSMFVALLCVLGLAFVSDNLYLTSMNHDDGTAYAMGLWPRDPRPQPLNPRPQPPRDPQKVNEPSTLILVGTGIAGIGAYFLLRRKRKDK
jgi:hypothetical protein